MITPFMSTASLSEATRVSLARSQARMVEAQEELASGRHADVGRTLGIRTAQTISLREAHSGMQVITDTNGILASRLDYTQTVLKGLTDAADTFLNAAIAGSASSTGAAVAGRAAVDALKSLTDLMNSSYDGVYIFSGLRTDTKPLADYYGTPAQANKLAVDNAFFAQFGMTQADPAIAGITGADMQTFLDGPFEALFDPTAWSSTWSSASDENLTSRISQREIIEASTNANEEHIRNLAQAFTMVADLGVGQLGEQARKSVLDKAVRLASGAVSGLNAMKSEIGIAQERVTLASERLSIQMDILSKDVATLENVDATEVSVRISALNIQIEASYALTARLHQLSLVRYL